MTKVQIDPGVCGLQTRVSCEYDDDEEVARIHVSSACSAIAKLTETIGDEFDPYEVCLVHPGEGPIYEFAKKNLPVHAACPAVAGIIKCIEAECRLALPKDVTIKFL